MNRTTLAHWILSTGVACTGYSAAAQITVEQDGSGDHTTITAAIAAASDGEVILIGAGTYAEGPISFLGKELTLDGVDPATRIIGSALDGDPVFIINGGQEKAFNALENLTISGGRSSGDGGGILLSGQTSLYIVNCTIEDNQSGENFDGGGLCVSNQSRCTVEGSRFIDNAASGGRGGGLYASDDSELVLTTTDFINNSAAVGGGACLDRAGDCTVERCLFAGNGASSSGGGLSIGGSNNTGGLEAPRVVSSAFTGNTAGSGGALRMVTYDDPDSFGIGGVGFVDNCTFSRNAAKNSPVISALGSVATDAITLRNCILWINTGSLSNPQLRPDFTHCQLDPDYLAALLASPSSTTLEDTSPIDPRFIDELGPDDTAGTGDENLRVMPGSPVIDQGTSVVGLTSADFDLGGNSRRIDDPNSSNAAGSGTPPIDRGAYELDPTQLDEQGFAIWNGDGADNGILDEDNWFEGVVSDSTHTWVFDDLGISNQATVEGGQALIGGLVLGSGSLSLDRADGVSGVVRLKDGPTTAASDYASLQITPYAGQLGALFLNTGLVADNVEIQNRGQLWLNEDAFIQVLGGGTIRIDGANSRLDAINVLESAQVTADLLNLGTLRITNNELSVDGDYQQSGTRLDGTEANGTLAIDLLAGKGATNRLKVTGQAHLSGNIAFELGQQEPPIKAGDSFTVLSADNGLGGTSFDFSVTRDGTGQGLAFILSTESSVAGGSEDVVATAVSISDLLAGAAEGSATAGASVQDLIFADIDGDGFEDMILSIDNGDAANGLVAVLLNEGVSGGSWDGFESYGTWLFTVEIGPRGLDVGFINDDEALDVVVANYNSGTFSVLLNNSTVDSVSFSATLSYDADSDPVSPSSLPVDVCVKNLDADPLGLSDVLVTNELDGSVWAFQNTSTFFSTSLDNEQESKPAKAIARFSPGRGGGVRNDDAVGSSDSDDGTSSGKPDSGSLAAGTGITMIWTSYDTPPGSEPVDLVTADFNGDGAIDVATINQGDSTISVFTDTGIGVYDPASTFSLPGAFSDPLSISAGDLDADGDIDLSYIADVGGQLVTATIRNTLAAPENSYGWVLDLTTDLGGQGPFLTRTSDVDNDGDDDVIALVTSSSLLASKSGPVPGFFTTEMEAVNPKTETCSGDYDGDGVVAGSDLATLLAAWGTEDAEIDLTGDALIDGADLATLLAAWGACDDEESIVD